MEFQRLRGTETNLFIALHGCARRGCAAALIEGLLRYLCAVVEPAEAFESCLTSGNITVGTGDALRLYLNDEVFSRGDMAIRWIRRFYRLARQYCFGLDDFVAEYFIEDLERCVVLDGSTFGGWVGHYRDNWYVSRLHARYGCELLVPFFVLLHRPVARWRYISELDEELARLVVGHEAVSSTELCDLTEEHLGHVDTGYQWLLVSNSVEVVTLDDGTRDEHFVADMSRVFPHFTLAAAGIESRNYLRRSGPGRANRNGELLAIDPSRIQQFFSSWGEPKTVQSVNWDEVCLKLRLRSRMIPRTVQGMDGALHGEVVKTLQRRGIVLSAGELCAELHIDNLLLRPERLPAGRIVAYAPGLRFLRQGGTRYGLREWVEDNTHRRGRISKTRIVSPLDFSMAAISEEAVLAAIDGDAACQRLGLVYLPRLLDMLRNSFGGARDGPQHVEIFRRRVISLLRPLYVPVGRGFWANRSRWKSLRGIGSSGARRLEVLTRLGLSDTVGDLVEPEARYGEDWEVLRHLEG